MQHVVRAVRVLAEARDDDRRRPEVQPRTLGEPADDAHVREPVAAEHDCGGILVLGMGANPVDLKVDVFVGGLQAILDGIMPDKVRRWVRRREIRLLVQFAIFGTLHVVSPAVLLVGDNVWSNHAE